MGIPLECHEQSVILKIEITWQMRSFPNFTTSEISGKPLSLSLSNLCIFEESEDPTNRFRMHLPNRQHPLL